MLSESELKNICMRGYREAETFTQKLQKERADALDYYHQEPYGDEVEGRSSFITTEVRDTIEWMLPQLLELFVGDEPPVVFSANGAENVEAAKVETAYINHAILNKNNGFLILYTWLKDALLQKNGIVKAYWDERVDEREETYEDQDFYGYQALVLEQDIEIKEVTVKFGEEELSLEESEGMDPLMLKYDISAVRTEDNSQERIENIPPENFYVNKDHPSLCLDEADLICHRETVSASDLIVDGYSKELVDSIPTGSEDQHEEERVNRFADEGDVTTTEYDRGTRDIQIYEFYIRVDADEDGKTELRMIKLAGVNGAVLLENEVVDSQPFCAWTPVINCHKFYGMSYADLVMDIQKLRSLLVRQVLDNLYLTNNPVKVVNPTAVYAEDLHYAGPGATWRATDPSAITVHQTPFVAGASLPILELTEEMRRDRTGVSPTTQGLDVKALADSTNTVGPMIMSQALQRVKMVARIFAETGFKDLVRKVHELCLKHGREDSFEYGGDYIPINPREWKERKQFKVKVGVGHVDKMQRVAAIGAILNSHRDIVAAGGMEGPLLTAQNIYEALTEQARLLGYPDGEKFYRDPQTYQPPQEEDPVSEALQIEEAKLIADTQKKATDNAMKAKDQQLDREKFAAEMDFKNRQLAQEKELRREEMVLKYGSSASKVQ